MSVLNVCSTTELDNSREQFLSRRYRNTPVAEQQGQKNLLYRRLYHHHHQHSGSTSSDSYDNYSSYTSSSSSSFEVLFSRLLDALIFTSAIAITAYSYLTGTLVVPQAVVEAPKPNLVGYNHHQQLTKRHSHHSLLDSNATGGNSLIQAADSIEDSKRKRTQEWAEQQINTSTAATPAISTNHHHSQSSHHHHNHQHIHSNSSPINSSTTKKRSYSVLDKKVQSLLFSSQDTNTKRDKKRTQSLPVVNVEKEDELLSKIQLLVQQGQDALEAPICGYS